ncbi:MAG: acyl carrier protein [Syntrophomonadaceae bacterium]|nr:acyl carrier protein [Syntrophomonadaceae bacterium]
MEKFFLQARGFLAEQLAIEEEKITMDTVFEDINADSIDIVEMIMALEDVYGVEFPEEDLEDYPVMGMLIKALFSFLQREGKA